MPADVQYSASLDDRQVLAALKNIDRNMDRLANQGDKAFTKVGRSARGMGVQVGATAGIVQELTRRFINMAEQAARALLEIARGGIELNKSLELLEIRITAILPSVKDLEESNKLAGRALILARSLGVNADFARRAVVEALAGQYVSIRRILNLSSAQVEKIKELEPAIGRAAAISRVLGDQLEAIGYDTDAIADSFTGVFALIESEAKQLQEVFAAPIFEELKEQAQAFLAVFEEHKDEFTWWPKPSANCWPTW